MAEEVTLKEQDNQEENKNFSNFDENPGVEEQFIPPGIIPPELEEESTFQRVEEESQQASQEDKKNYLIKNLLL
ncbi:hypothetical protein [Campylobacter armoricus]|uniref:hypothetical protein n=1 Tax=Campylobacter armoricus TaxID=2505970 RepID=UPI001117128B|nr:hypothetical protein [Campylobacter armoricus]